MQDYDAEQIRVLQADRQRVQQFRTRARFLVALQRTGGAPLILLLFTAWWAMIMWLGPYHLLPPSAYTPLTMRFHSFWWALMWSALSVSLAWAIFGPSTSRFRQTIYLLIAASWGLTCVAFLWYSWRFHVFTPWSGPAAFLSFAAGWTFLRGQFVVSVIRPPGVPRE